MCTELSNDFFTPFIHQSSNLLFQKKAFSPPMSYSFTNDKDFLFRIASHNSQENHALSMIQPLRKNILDDQKLVHYSFFNQIQLFKRMKKRRIFEKWANYFDKLTSLKYSPMNYYFMKWLALFDSHDLQRQEISICTRIIFSDGLKTSSFYEKKLVDDLYDCKNDIENVSTNPDSFDVNDTEIENSSIFENMDNSNISNLYENDLIHSNQDLEKSPEIFLNEDIENHQEFPSINQIREDSSATSSNITFSQTVSQQQDSNDIFFYEEDREILIQDDVSNPYPFLDDENNHQTLKSILKKEPIENKKSFNRVLFEPIINKQHGRWVPFFEQKLIKAIPVDSNSVISKPMISMPSEDSPIKAFIRQFFFPDLFQFIQQSQILGKPFKPITIPPQVRRPFDYHPVFFDLLLDLINEILQSIDLTKFYYEKFLSFIESQINPLEHQYSLFSLEEEFLDVVEDLEDNENDKLTFLSLELVFQISDILTSVNLDEILGL